MEKSVDGHLLVGLGWAQMIERTWPGLVRAGLPRQLESLARDLGHYRERPVRVFTMPMLEAGVAGLALPFVADDGIVLDPSLATSGGHRLGEVVARELAYMLHPHWEDPGPDDDEKMESFACKLAPMLLAKPPDYQWIDVAVLASPGRATPMAG
jgi:hypothetical protein